MIVLLRSADYEYDSRLRKYIKVLEEESKDFIVLHWPRNRKVEDTNNLLSCKERATYGGKFANLMGYFKWFVFLFAYLFNHRKEIKIIHAIDFDTGIVSLVMKLLFNKNYIYEIYDHYADSRNLKGSARKVINGIEKIIAKKAKSVVLVDKARIEQHKFSENLSIKIIENVPNFSVTRQQFETQNSERLSLCYVGVLEKQHRGLENLLKVAEKLPVELHIAGFGGVESLFKNCQFANVHFYGSVNHERAQELMQGCDLMLGLYYLSNHNHFYASPNKYYEHLALGKPLLTSKGTPPGDKVAKYNTGWAIGDSYNELYKVLSEIIAGKKQELVEKGSNAYNVWQNNYSNYHLTLKSTYLDLVD